MDDQLKEQFLKLWTECQGKYKHQPDWLGAGESRWHGFKEWAIGGEGAICRKGEILQEGDITKYSVEAFFFMSEEEYLREDEYAFHSEPSEEDWDNGNRYCDWFIKLWIRLFTQNGRRRDPATDAKHWVLFKRWAVGGKGALRKSDELLRFRDVNARTVERYDRYDQGTAKEDSDGPDYPRQEFEQLWKRCLAKYNQDHKPDTDAAHWLIFKAWFEEEKDHLFPDYADFGYDDFDEHIVRDYLFYDIGLGIDEQNRRLRNAQKQLESQNTIDLTDDN